jgi:hypothetical protein
MPGFRWIDASGREHRFPDERALLKALFVGEIQDEDLVFVPGSGAWVRASEVKERVGESLGSDPDEKVHRPNQADPHEPFQFRAGPYGAGFAEGASSGSIWEEALQADNGLGKYGERDDPGGLIAELEQAGWKRDNAPWRRYFARLGDVMIAALALGVLGEIVAPDLAGETSESGMLFLAILIAVPLLDGLFLSKWHTSPGKWMLSVRTVPVSGAISFGDAYARSWSMLMRGMWFGVPFLSLIPLIGSYSKASAGERLAWEKASGTVTLKGQFGLPFLMFLGLVALAIFGVLIEAGL